MRGVGPVEDELHRGADAGEHGQVGDPPVEHEVHVHDRGHTETPDRAERTLAHELSCDVGRGGDDDRVGLDHPLAGPDHRWTAPRRVDPIDGRRQCHLHPGLGKRGGGPVAVQDAQGHPGPADVPGIGPVEETGAEHHGGERERRVVGRQVEGRQRDEVPQHLDRLGPLSVRAEPVPERAVVETGVVEVEPSERQGRPGQPQPVAHTEVPVAGERTGEVQRGGQRRAGDDGPPASGREHRDLETLLQEHHVRGPDPVEQPPVGGAAPQKDVLAVVERPALAPERPGEAPELASALEKGDAGAAVGRLERGGDAGEAAPDDDDVALAHGVHPASARTATRAFSRPGSETRPRVTAIGSASIRSSSRR